MPSKSKCVHCGEEIYEWVRDCPKCGRPVANPDAPLVKDLKWKTGGQNRKKNMMPLLIAVILIVLAIAVYFLKYQQ